MVLPLCGESGDETLRLRYERSDCGEAELDCEMERRGDDMTEDSGDGGSVHSPAIGSGTDALPSILYGICV